ncbi:MAG: SdrD B-like domain-containing protein [Prosthecobacter sp.]|uniref:SdrD B-like domain-containing protein n=1 Tax=Prosthecobacter sp. TaxID=1965333 RepID=UPI003BB1372F
MRDAGELGISGATVQLFSPGADNAVGGSGANADTQVGASVLTSSTGVYAFTNLVPGKYYVRVTPTVSVPGVSSVVVTLDNDVDNDNNGSQPGGPGTFVYSPVIDLQVGTEPATGVDGDGTNGNNTLDFGLFTGITVGDLVWNDVNNNGLKDTTETGVSGVQVDLMNPGADNAVGGSGLNADTVLQTISTLSGGSYSFKVYTGGNYYVRLTPPAAYSLASSTVVTADNGVNNDSNGSQPGGAGSVVNSMVFALTPGGEPGSTGLTNTENTIDFGLRSCPAITITPATLTNALKGSAYSATFNAAGGNSPYVWSLATGSTLPGGLALSSAGVLSGSPTAATGTYSFTVKVVDASNCSATQAMTIGVVCPTLTLSPTTLSSVAQNTAFSQQFTTTGGTSAYTYTRPSGTLPTGATLSSSGLLSGTITGAPGTYSFVVRSTDANGCALDTSFNWVVTCPALSLSPTTVPAATQYAAYSPQTLTASNGTSPYTWSFTGTMPSGMTLSSGGILSGTPSSAPGTYNITVTATDANGCAKSGVYAITVNCPSFTITAPTFPSATKNVAYPNQQLSASGGTTPYNWTIASGALPAGMSMSTAGLISGTPTAVPATYNFTVRATDSVNCSVTKALAIVIACPTLTITPATLPAGVQYAAYSQTLTAANGTSPYTWSLASGVLPAGMTLSSGGVLSGTPTSLGSFTFVVRATDADNCSSTISYTFTVNYPPIFITPSTLSNATRLVPYFTQLTATGGTAPYTFSKLTGSLPTGLSISTAGAISGTTTASPGTYSFTVQALDVNGAPGTQPYTITIVCPTMTISPTTLTNGVVGTAYTASLTVSGGSAPYIWSVASGALPAGLSMSASGLISGTPTQATTASFTVQAVDSFNCSSTQIYTLSVNCPSVSITPTSLTSAYYAIPYSQQLTSSGGTGPYTYAVIAGSPPAGMTVSSSGLLSGSAQVYGTANFTVRSTDAYNCSATQSYSLLVKGLSIGDTVYEDSNFNGLRDVGESGISGVTVELWDPGADHAIGGSGPNSDLMFTSTTTNGQGQYTFINLQPGTYFMRVLMPTELNIIGGNPVNLDNGVDNDNNAASQPGGPGTPVFSPVITLATGAEPTVDDGDADTENTIDFGLFRGMNVGNLVWQDTNDNGLRDNGEPGIDGVTVQLWNAGADGSIGGTDDVLLRTTTTSAGGAYLFTSVPPLKVYVRIPRAPAAQPLSSSNTTFVDNGVDNDDNGLQLSGGAVNSPVITLTAADEPGTGGGTYNETTIDFGFVNVTPSIYVSATQADSIQAFNSSTGLYSGSLVPAFGTSLSQGNADYGDVPYGMELGQDGNWYVAHYGASNLRKISPTGTDLGPVLDNSATSMSLVSQFAIGPDGNFYVYDVNGGRVVRFQGPTGDVPGKPIGASAPYTFITQTDVEDMNFGPDGNLYLVVQTNDTREVRRYSTTTGALLNAIVTDIQLMAMVPGGQSIALISGIDIEGSTLYGVNRSDGEVFSVDLSTPAAPGLPQLIATLSSAGKGEVDTRDIEFNPSNNKLYISGYSWGKPVNAGSFNSGALISVDITTAPNGTVNVFEVPIPRPPGPNFEIWSGPRDLAIGRPFAPLPDSVAIGSLVWNDDNANGIQDAAELGIPGVRVDLWRDLNGDSADGAEFLVGWTYTDNKGFYYFSGQAPGVYQLQIPESNFVDGLPLAGSGYSSPISSNVDDQIDGDDSGRQPGGPKTVVNSPLITLTPGAEPVGNGSAGAEFGRGGELDNYTVDANGDMTVDFGFVEPGIMGIGNLVFVDDNGNNRFDVGEGRDDVTIQLYRWGDTPGVTTPVATAVTANGGLYLFSNLWQGQYFIHLPAYQFESSGNLRGLYSLPVVTAGDDNTGQDALPTDTPWITGVSTGIINLVRDQAPSDTSSETGFDSSTDLNDINIDLTEDIGLYRPVALGNMVFADNNSNGHYDSGEGLSGVRVEIYTDTQFPEVDNPLAFTTSDSTGRYGFNFLRPGNYLVHIPSSQFQVGGPLYQRISILEGLVGDDDVGEDGINDGLPTDNGVSSLVISLYPGNAPTDDSGETGFEYTSDDQNDAAIDLTIDFGFQTPVGVGNLVFIDTNQNSQADVGEGVDGVTVELYRSSQTPGFGVPLFSTITSGGGQYFFDSLPAGDYVVHIPYTQFEPGRPLNGLSSLAGASSASLDLDDDVPDSENGLDDASPFLNGISSAVFTLAVNAEPTDASGETGAFKTIDSFDDDNFNLTIDFGFALNNPNGVGVGNLVFVDLNGNGVYDSGEGIDGVKVQLFSATADVHAANPISTVISNNGGSYIFSNLVEGAYKIFIPATEFAAGKPLSGWRSLPGDGADNGVDDNVDENGVDVEDPSATGVESAQFYLSPGNEPTDSLGEFGSNAFMDDANDANTDLTVDFGFFRSVAVGNLVFLDANFNGRADAGEGVGGVTLELYNEGAFIPFDAPVATTTTNTDGTYLFADLAPGRYFVRVPSWQFDFGSPLFGYASIFGTQSGDDSLGEDGLDNGNPSVNGIQTAIIDLTPTNAPTGSQEGGFQGSSDDINDVSTNLTVDLGFVLRSGVGNVVFNDLNNDGLFDPGNEYGVDGVTVELWSNEANATTAVGSTTTYGGGLYSFSVAPGSYYVKIPDSNFLDGGALANLVPSKPVAAGSAVPTTTAGDDDTKQDGYTTGAVLTEGARTPVFTLVPAQSPTAADTETGYYSESDDFDDANVDLTIDLGFAPKPLSVGNLIFRDVNSNGHYDSADFGVAGVNVRLFKVGDDPATATPVMETTTSIDGTYLLNTYEEGQYFLYIPATQFTSGGALFGTTSATGVGSDDGQDDGVDENGQDAANPTSTGVSSTVFALAYGTEPQGEAGFLNSMDEFNDADVDLTIDMGFSGGTLPSLMNIGNLVFNDANNNGVADAGEGVPGVWMLLYAGSGTAGSTSFIRSTTTDASGRYFFTNLSPGVYTVHVAADNFKASISINGGPVGPGPLYKMMSLRGNQTTLGDDNLGEDGIDSQSPEQVGITAPAVTLTANAAPTGAQEGGFQGTSDDANDSNADLTIDFGFSTRLGVGNLVFRDANADGKYQAGVDSGLAGIQLELVYNDGAGAEKVVSTTTTDTTGKYLFYAPPTVTPQTYYVRIPATQFTATGPLNFLVPSMLTTNGSDDNLNQNAQPAADPGTTGVVTAGFSLGAGTLPTDTDGRESGFDKTSDNDDDANIDLTIDLGLKAKALMVGNLVFRDANSNGTYEAGIDVAMANVTVQLFQQAQAVTDTPVSEAVTAADGTYMLYATAPAAYYVHIPASMFAAAAPLDGMTSVVGTGNVVLTTNADTAKDDRFDENGDDATQPSATGVSSGIINLAYGTMPLNSSVTAATGENGFQSFMDDAADESGMMTVDFGFLGSAGSPNGVEVKRNLVTNPGTATTAATFTAWQTQNSLSGLNSPNDDPDADGQTNLLEYALGTAGGSGLGVSRFTLVNNTVSGAIDAVLTRPAGEHADLRYSLEGSNDLSTWTTLALTPVTTANADQTETLRYSAVESAFSGAARGYLRIKVTLDANLDGTPEATATTGAQGWARMQFAVGRQSLSMPLLLPAVYTGQVASVSGRTVVLSINGGDIRTQLQNGVSYYVEVLNGALTGRTWDLDATVSTSSSISLTTSADSALAGARIRIRPHWTLGALLPVSGLQAAATADTADRLMFFDSASGQFLIDWLQAATNGGAQWVRDGDASLANDAARVIPPQTGMLVQIRSTPATLTFLGEVRSAALALPQTAGTALLGTGLATAKTPGAQPFTIGSRLRLWSGDTDPATAVYQNYLLNPQSQWVDETTGLEVTNLTLLDGFRAFFLVKP